MATNQSGTADLGKLVLRVTLGVLILMHGLSKVTGGVGFITNMVGNAGLPETLGYLVYVGEVVAPLFLIDAFAGIAAANALLLIVGAWTRAAAAIVAINMIVAVALAHRDQIFSVSDSGGWALELQGIYLLTAVAVTLLGAGRFSIGGAGGRLN